MGAESIPLLIQFLFPDSVDAAWRNATEQVRGWCLAFEAWMQERDETCRPNTHKQAVLTWRRLVRERGLGPWELSRADVEAHVEWMLAEGYASSTVANAVGMVGSFYRWCGDLDRERRERGHEKHERGRERGRERGDERHERYERREREGGVYLEGWDGVNPAEGVVRPRVRRYGGRLLSRAEVGALLGVLERGGTALGRRDYAFFLARLRMGVSLERLRKLTWAAVEAGDGLPGEVCQAVRAYLQASGRLEGMEAGEAVFAPLKYPMGNRPNDRREDWVNGQSVSEGALLWSLKVYGRTVGIAEEKLNLACLRRTAIRLRVETGASLEEMQAFTESVRKDPQTKHRLKQLPELEAGQPLAPADPPDRSSRPFQLGKGVKHGLYAARLPEEAVLAVVAERVEGVESELVGFRILARGLLKLRGEAQHRADAARLLDAYSLAARRIGMVLELELQLSAGGESELEEALRQALEVVNRELRGEDVDLDRRDPLLPEFVPDPPENARDKEEPPKLDPNERRLQEEIAGTRFVLRNLFDLALQEDQVKSYLHLVDLYGLSCLRLMRLLKDEATLEKDDDSTLEAALRRALDEVNSESPDQP